jgi:hypothetical protein
MAGTDPSFDSGAFRTAIRAAMQMGLPSDPTQAITFRFDETLAFPVHDPAAHPYNWTEAPATDVAKRDVQVPAAVQWAAGTVTENPIGAFDTSRVVVTILDVDYALVAGCNEVLINGTHFVIDTIGPPLGLFDVEAMRLPGAPGDVQALLNGVTRRPRELATKRDLT